MAISAQERRSSILEILNNAASPISGGQLSKKLGVSRQIIVQDISILKASHPEILATSKGYLIAGKFEGDGAQTSKAENEAYLKPNGKPRRVFKVKHSDDQMEDEMRGIVELGGVMLDVKIEHRVYGTISRPLNVSSIRDIKNFMNDIKSGVSSPLKNLTSGYHYHTIEAKNIKILDEIEEMLREKGYLIETLDGMPTYKPKDYNNI